MSEELNARNITLDPGTNLEIKFNLVLICPLCLQLLQKVRNTLNSTSIPKQYLFQAWSSIKDDESRIS